MKADKLYLVGFMGAGKTSVARALGRRIRALPLTRERIMATLLAGE